MSATQSLSALDQMIIEHVTPTIAKLSRDKAHLAENMFAEEVWAKAPTVYGQRISFLEATHELPLRYHETISSNSRTYWITSESG